MVNIEAFTRRMFGEGVQSKVGTSTPLMSNEQDTNILCDDSGEEMTFYCDCIPNTPESERTEHLFPAPEEVEETYRFPTSEAKNLGAQPEPDRLGPKSPVVEVPSSNSDRER